MVEKKVHEDELIKLINENPDLANSEIASHFGVSRERIRALRVHLHKNGAITSLGKYKRKNGEKGMSKTRKAGESLKVGIAMTLDEWNDHLINLITQARRAGILENQLAITQTELSACKSELSAYKKKEQEKLDRERRYQLAVQQGELPSLPNRPLGKMVGGGNYGEDMGGDITYRLSDPGNTFNFYPGVMLPYDYVSQSRLFTKDDLTYIYHKDTNLSTSDLVHLRTNSRLCYASSNCLNLVRKGAKDGEIFEETI